MQETDYIFREHDLDRFQWPDADYAHTPYRVFKDAAIYEREMEKIFRGPVWGYLALEAELPEAVSFKSVLLGNTPVVVSREEDGSFSAFVNRCAHRGATVVREEFGKADTHACIYHQWCYSSQGDLVGVPYRRGVSGKGGYPKDFKPTEHGLRKLHVESYKGLIFGSLGNPPGTLLDYLGPHIKEHLDRILVKPLKVLGYHRQRISANWKLYFENIKDPYHAGLLHMFAATFGTYRSTQEGYTLVSDGGGHSIVYSVMGTDDHDSVSEHYKDVKDKYQSDFQLNDGGLLQWTPDFDDGIGNLIISVFPNLVVQQILNTLATRQVRPLGPDGMELVWTFFGFEDDSQALTDDRLKQLNLVGPAGYISMEDGEAIRLVQQAIQGETDATSFIQMGGRGPIVDADHVVTEVCTRGFWKQYAQTMAFPPREEQQSRERQQ